jgi:hypothetical protein
LKTGNRNVVVSTSYDYYTVNVGHFRPSILRMSRAESGPAVCPVLMIAIHRSDFTGYVNLMRIQKSRRVDYEIALGRSTREIDARGCRRVERTGRLNRRCDSLSGYHRDRRALPARIASPWGLSKYLTSFVSSANSEFCLTVRLAIHRPGRELRSELWRIR